MSVQPNLPDMVQERLCQMVFEDFEFESCAQVTSHSMIRMQHLSEHSGQTEASCQLVVDSGFSFTTIVPFFGGLPLRHASTRVDVGGKLLTNLLAENLSYKEINLRGEAHLVNHIKEATCFVSRDFAADMKKCCHGGKTLLKEYVLPDYRTFKKGFVRDEQPDAFVSAVDEEH